MKTITKTQKMKLKRLTKQQYSLLKDMCYHSKCLYNSALYLVRQYYFNNKKYLSYNKVWQELKNNEHYKSLQDNISQQILRQVDKDFRSFFALMRKVKKGQYHENVHIPKYKKEDFYNILASYNSFRIRDNKISIGLPRSWYKDNNLKFTQNPLKFNVPSFLKNVKYIRVVPKYNAKYFILEVIYEENIKEHNLDNSKYLSIDLGISNFASCITTDGSSFILGGETIKTYNQYFNKKLAKLQSIKDKQKIKILTKRQQKHYERRNGRIRDLLHKASKFIINYCIENKIGNIVIGEWKGIKNKVNLGKENNQKFINIPHGTFKQMLEYKAEENSINFIFQEESYTSKCSFLDDEEIKKHNSYLGSRIKRGLFKTKNNILINADINGAANILKKAFPDLNRRGVMEGFINNPKRIRLNEQTSFKTNSKFL